MKAFISNLKRAIQNRESVTIGGGEFSPDELRTVLSALENGEKINSRLRDEHTANVMSDLLLKFCKNNDLPFESADDLALRPDLTEFQFGYLMAYITLWERLID